MPEDEYAQRGDSVLAFKRKNHLGRFDPNAPAEADRKVKEMEALVKDKGMC